MQASLMTVFLRTGTFTPPVRAHVRRTQITAHNAGWRSQFRFAGGVLWSGVCEFHRSARQRFD